jgi:hypothetical protein
LLSICVWCGTLRKAEEEEGVHQGVVLLHDKRAELAQGDAGDGAGDLRQADGREVQEAQPAIGLDLPKMLAKVPKMSPKYPKSHAQMLAKVP